jgi:hypothetical protein
MLKPDGNEDRKDYDGVKLEKAFLERKNHNE